MRRVGRVMIAVAAAVSLLLALAVAGLWARSVWWQTADWWLYSADLKSEGFVFASVDGVMSLAWGQSSPFASVPGFDHDDSPYDPSLSPAMKWWRPLQLTTWGTDSSVSVADWLPLLLFSVLPLWWALQRGPVRIRRQRLRLGLCARCGYEVRATTDKCPECGAARAAN
jgi:hypothetical protein